MPDLPTNVGSLTAPTATSLPNRSASATIISNRCSGMTSPALGVLSTLLMERRSNLAMAVSIDCDARAAWALVGGLKDESRMDIWAFGPGQDGFGR
ncbi:hypothetical protein RSOLAG1IB_01209 [Rhizoctonia solani AG-1 IB]|uniref:Uncharacterized protein n=1 Tax=Thanatephorus cucumeris (strain AG1-IB / isolate 7/3/14) TaxID=1108050 RepID=A0A0B7FAX0_THACB|nr:hypothetical protein RSOLAG1IB_01209 [Rhizoctonia solani AG-1 IB]